MGALLVGTLYGSDETTGGSDPIETARLVVEGVRVIDALDPSITLPGAGPGSGWSEIVAQSPNLAISAAGPSSFGAVFALRGLANTPYFSDPAVGIYFDTIPLGSAFTYPSDFSGFTSATVYTGPQPAGFARGAEAGVISFSPPPAMDSTEATLRLGNYQARSESVLAGITEGPGTDTLLAVSLDQRSGFIENTAIGSPVDTLRSFSGFLRQRYAPVPGVRISLEVLGDTHRDGAAPLVPLGAALRTVQRAREGSTDTNLAGVALQANLELPLGTLSETSSATRWQINPYSDWLVLPPPLQSTITQRQNAVNQEFRLTSRDGTEDPWTLGAWLSTGTTAGASDRSIKGILPIEVSSYGYSREEASVFGNLAIKLLPGWSLAVGLRAQTVTKDYHQSEAVPIPDLHFRLSREDEALLPSLKLNYSGAASVTGWAGVSLGTKPGGFAAYTDNPALIPFSPETALAFESGIQRSLGDGAVTLSLHAFDYEIRNYQIERSFSSTDYFVANAPHARSAGVEFEGVWRPGTHWTLRAGGGIDRVLLLTFTDPLTKAGEDGKTAPFSPAYSFSSSARYDSLSGWFAAVDCAGFGRTYYSESENARYSQAAYGLLGFRLGRERKHWRLTCFVQNANDRGYYTLIVPGVNSAAPGAPITYGAELTLKR